MADITLQNGTTLTADLAGSSSVEAVLTQTVVDVTLPDPPGAQEVALGDGTIIAVDVVTPPAIDAIIERPINDVTLTRGARGVPARQDIVLCSLGGLGYAAGEVLVVANIAGEMTFDPAYCLATLEAAPTADCTFTIDKNGAAFATAFFAAGHTDGVVTLTGTKAIFRDKLRLLAPIPADATALGPSVTLASA